MHSLKAFKIKSRVKLELAAICPHQWKQNRGLLKTAAEKGQDGFSRWSLIAETHSLHPQCTLLSLFHTHLPSRNTAQGHRALRAVRTSVNGAHASCGPHTHTQAHTQGDDQKIQTEIKSDKKGDLKKRREQGERRFCQIMFAWSTARMITAVMRRCIFCIQAPEAGFGPVGILV